VLRRKQNFLVSRKKIFLERRFFRLRINSIEITWSSVSKTIFRLSCHLYTNGEEEKERRERRERRERKKEEKKEKERKEKKKRKKKEKERRERRERRERKKRKKRKKKMEITDLVVESKVTKKVFYLSYDYSSSGNSLYARDLPLSTDSALHSLSAQKIFGLQHTLAISAAVSNSNSNSSKDVSSLSKEEELLRERQRKFANGVSSYETLIVGDTLHLLIPAYGTIYYASWGTTCSASSTDGAFFGSPLFTELRTNDESARVDVKWSPDAMAVSYVKRNEIWVSSLGGEEVRLTYATDRSHCSAGVAEFIMQEEFDRYTGYWWAPVTSAGGTRQQQHRILYCEVDESSVRDFHVSEPLDIRGSTETFKYPLAGEDNAITELCLLEFDMDALFEASKRRHTNNYSSHNSDNRVDPVIRSLIKERRLNLNKRFPNFEYVVRCGWIPNGDRIWVQLVDRKQQKLVLLAIDLTLFDQSSESIVVEEGNAFDQPGVILLWKEDSDCWLNVRILQLISSSLATEILMFWKR